MSALGKTDKIKVGSSVAMEYVAAAQAVRDAGEDNQDGTGMGDGDIRVLEDEQGAAESDGDVQEPELDISRVCPVCGQAHGTLRHVLLTCTHPQMVAIRAALSTYVERLMRQAATMETRARASACAVDMGGCRHPTGWVGTDDALPILHMLG